MIFLYFDNIMDWFMELTLEEALQKAVKAHKAGQIQEADDLYKGIIQSQPKHPNANRNIGVLAVSVSKIHEALPFFKTALEANSSIGQFWQSYAELLSCTTKPLSKAKITSTTIHVASDSYVQRLCYLVYENYYKIYQNRY